MLSPSRAPTTTGSTGNRDLEHKPARDGESNVDWLARMKAREGLILIGGASLSHFRLRVAQSHLRRDLLPSFWSVAGFLHDGGRSVDTVTFNWGGHASTIPKSNAILTRPIETYADPGRYPNIAFIRFAAAPSDVLKGIERVKEDRAIVDLPRLVVEWLGFVWGARAKGNPLLDRIGVPSACFVEAAYAIAGIELTPGLAADASCPEAIWQSAKWWRSYYEETTRETKGKDGARIPIGAYALRQKAAAVTDEDGQEATGPQAPQAPKAPKARKAPRRAARGRRSRR